MCEVIPSRKLRIQDPPRLSPSCSLFLQTDWLKDAVWPCFTCFHVTFPLKFRHPADNFICRACHIREIGVFLPQNLANRETPPMVLRNVDSEIWFIVFVSPYRFHIRPSSYCVMFVHDYHICLKGKKTWNPWGYLHFWMAPTVVSWQNVLGIHPVKNSWNSKKSQDVVLPPGLWYRFDRAIKLSQQAQHLSFMLYINCDCTGRPHHVYDVRIWQDAYG